MARNQRLNATLTIGSVLERSVGRHLNVIRQGLDSVNSEIADLTARRRDMERQRQELERQGRSVEDLDREYEDLGRTLEDLRRRQERFERASAAAGRVGQRFGTMTSEIGRFARGAAVGIGALGGAIVALTRQQSEGIEELTRWANRIGVTTEYLSELDSVAGRFGLGTEDLVDGLKELSLRADEFAFTGAGPAAEAFERLGFSQAEVNEMAGDTAAMFEIVRERMSHIIDDAARQRIADELFGGTAGERMIEVLQLTQAELDAMREEARAAGATVTQEQSAIAREMSLSFGRLGAVIRGVTRSVSVELMPAVTTAFGGLADHLIENREQIVQLGAAVAERIGAAIPVALELAKGVGTVAARIGEGIGALADFVGGWENLGVIVGTVLAGRVIVSVGAFLGSIVGLGRAMWALAPALPVVAAGIRAIGVALAANPIGLAVTAIAGGALLIYQNWESIEPRLRAVIDAIGAGFTWLWENAAEPVIEGLRVAGGAIVSAWQAVQEGVGAALDALGAAFRRVYEFIEPVVSALRWVGDAGGAILDRLNRDAAPGEVTGSSNRREQRTQARAVGGAFRAGPVLVGERGPELRYEAASGFVAHHAALQRLAGYAEQAAGGLAGAGREAAQRVAQVTQNITINAQGLTAAALIDEIDRRRRDAERGALFDGAGSFGQYGGAHA